MQLLFQYHKFYVLFFVFNLPFVKLKNVFVQFKMCAF